MLNRNLFTLLAMVSPLLLAARPSAAGQVIGQMTDPVQTDTEAAVDIISATIEQDGGLVTFSMEMRGPIPTTLAGPNEHITFLWLVDADNNPATGQPHEQIGTEFNVRVVISSEAWMAGGYVDVTGSMHGGGTGTILVQGSRVQITVGLGQIGNPSQFHWVCDAAHVVNDVAISANHETGVAIANTLPHTPPATVEIVTPLLMLCPTGPATGQLQVQIRDAAGNVLPTGDYLLSFESSNPAVASIDASGLVTAHAAPVQFDDTPYVRAWADGIEATNSAVIRVTGSNLGVSHQMYRGEHTGFYLVPNIEGVDLDQITTGQQVVEATELAYAAQDELMSSRPFRGGTQYFVLDVAGDPTTVPCGLSGNPVRLGWEWGKPVHNSCYIINWPDDRRPQWGVIFHEMGHNFTWASWGFGQFCGASPDKDWMYSEALASMAGAWCWHRLTQCPRGLSPAVLQDISEDYPNINPASRQALIDYLNSGADYSNVNIGVICDILWELSDDYGRRIWYDLFSTLSPANEPLPVVLDSEAKRTTWLAAAASVSANEDLRGRFISRYGFPIDFDAWDEMFAACEARIAARPLHEPTPADYDCDGDVDGVDYGMFASCFNGTGNPIAAGCERVDIDGDHSVDGVDYGLFASCFNGSGNPPGC